MGQWSEECKCAVSLDCLWWWWRRCLNAAVLYAAASAAAAFVAWRGCVFALSQVLRCSWPVGALLLLVCSGLARSSHSAEDPEGHVWVPACMMQDLVRRRSPPVPANQVGQQKQHTPTKLQSGRPTAPEAGRKRAMTGGLRNPASWVLLWHAGTMVIRTRRQGYFSATWTTRWPRNPRLQNVKGHHPKRTGRLEWEVAFLH